MKVLAIILLLAVPAMAQDAIVRASFPAKDPLLVGQRGVLLVEILVPGYFAGSAVFDLPRVPGLMIIPPSERPVIGSETIGEVTYTSQRHELSVIARRGGEITIPAFPVRFEFNAGGVTAAQAKRVMTKPLTLKVTTPPGAENISPLITTTDLTMEVTWSTIPDTLKLGDAVTRTVTIHAANVPGMFLPPLPEPDIKGLGVYPKPAEVRDQANRGNLTGERVQTTTYICQSPGQYTIPAYVVKWWDLDDKQLKSARIEGKRFTVPAPPQPETPKPATHEVPWIALAVGVAAVGFVLYRRRPKPFYGLQALNPWQT